MANILQDFHRAPLLRIAVFLMAGILLQRIVSISWALLLILFLGSLLLLWGAYLYIRTYQTRHIFGMLLLAAYLFCGSVLYAIHQKNHPVPEIPQQGVFTGYISSLAYEKEKSVFAAFSICAVGDSVLARPIESWLYIEKTTPDSILQPGNWCMIDTKLQIPHKNKLPTEFDFYDYLQSQNVHYTAFVRSTQITSANLASPINLTVLSLKIKQRVLHIFRQNGLKNEELALVSALTIGYKKLLPAEQREAYAASGAMHVLAVSGLHVGILFLLFSRLLGFIKKLPYGNICFTVLVILLLFGFAFITGFSPSVTRATVMFSFISFGKALHRKQYIVNTIAASAIVLLAGNPALLFNIGFQLSYVAVTGIVLFYPILEQKFRVSGKIAGWIMSLVLVSIIAQMVSAPLNMFYFHRMANYGVLANLWVIPLVTIVLNITLLLIALGLVGIYIPGLGTLINGLAKSMNGGVYFISQLPGSTFESIYISPLQCWMLYTALLALLFLLLYRNKWLIWVILSGTLLLLIQRTLHKYVHYTQNKMVVYQHFNTTRLLLKAADEGLVIVADRPQDISVCPVWFFREHVHENKVVPVTYTSSFTGQNICLYRQFVQCNKHIIFVGNRNHPPEMIPHFPFEVSAVVQLAIPAKWHVSSYERPTKHSQPENGAKMLKPEVNTFSLNTQEDAFKMLFD